MKLLAQLNKFKFYFGFMILSLVKIMLECMKLGAVFLLSFAMELE